MSTERRLKITRGKKPAKAGPENGVGYGPIVSIDGRVLCHTVIWPNHDESEANAALYADAHNTANEVDLLPSELLAKLREAEKLLLHAVSYPADAARDGNEDAYALVAAIKQFLSTTNLKP